jgi:hypothetical protein
MKSVSAFLDAECTSEDGSGVQTLACVFREHIVRVLMSGSHPLSLLCQRLTCAVQSLYGPLGVHRYGLLPKEALEYVMSDTKTVLTRVQVSSDRRACMPVAPNAIAVCVVHYRAWLVDANMLVVRPPSLSPLPPLPSPLSLRLR